MAEVITYNGVDITGKVNASKVTHEMYAGGHPDTLSITFQDDEHLWSKWKPQIGDCVTYKNDGASTGNMYVFDLEVTDTVTKIYAYSLPPSLKVRYTKTWESVYLSQILKELSGEYEILGMDDVWYKYKLCNEKISGFINSTAELEAAVFIYYNDKAILINEEALEAQGIVSELDCIGYRVTVKDHRAQLYDACIVQSGKYQGVCRVGSGERLYKPNISIPCSSDAEANRFAKALLRMANKQMYDIRLQGQIIPELSAGICVNLINNDMPDHQGKMFVYRVRHEYHRNKTTAYMRMPLEGY